MGLQRLWIPLPLERLTANELLDALRAEGFYEGKRAAISRGRYGLRAVAPARSFSGTSRDLRQPAKLYALRAGLERMKRAAIWLDWCGSGREDPDAWTVAEKPIVDGLVDARVFESDRRNVESVGGRCVSSRAEAEEILATIEPHPGKKARGVLLTFTYEAA